MTNWLKRINGAIAIGLTWAVGWALLGLMIEVACSLWPDFRQNAFIAAFDAPLRMMTLALPGFLCGVFFSTVAGIAERRHPFGELSLSRFAVWGVAGGLMLMLIPILQIAEDLARGGGAGIGPVDIPLAAVVGVFAPLSAVSAAAFLALARSAEPWRSFLGQLLGSDQRHA
jgi:hypothetical protein